MNEKTQSKGQKIPSNAKPYLDIYADANNFGDGKRLTVVTEALYNQYKEKSRKHIIQQQ